MVIKYSGRYYLTMEGDYLKNNDRIYKSEFNVGGGKRHKFSSISGMLDLVDEGIEGLLEVPLKEGGFIQMI